MHDGVMILCIRYRTVFCQKQMMACLLCHVQNTIPPTTSTTTTTTTTTKSLASKDNYDVVSNVFHTTVLSTGVGSKSSCASISTPANIMAHTLLDDEQSSIIIRVCVCGGGGGGGHY